MLDFSDRKLEDIILLSPSVSTIDSWRTRSALSIVVSLAGKREEEGEETMISSKKEEEENPQLSELHQSNISAHCFYPTCPLSQF